VAERIHASRTTLLQRRVLAATALSYVVVILDTSIVNVALERIAEAFTTGIAGLQWVVNAYIISFASLLLTGGALGDRLGARNVYLAGLIVFTLASALCGAASGLPMLTAARVLQGIGAAMLVPSSLSLINNAYPDPGQRAAAIGLWAGFGGVALAAGPLVGGVLIHLLGWRGIFLINVPVGAVGVWLTTRIERGAGVTLGRHLDLAGQAAAIVALGLLIAPLIEGPVLGWRSPLVLGGFVGSLLAWAAFLSLEASRPQPNTAAYLLQGPGVFRFGPGVGGGRADLLRADLRAKPLFAAHQGPLAVADRASVPAADGAGGNQQRAVRPCRPGLWAAPQRLRRVRHLYRRLSGADRGASPCCDLARSPSHAAYRLRRWLHLTGSDGRDDGHGGEKPGRCRGRCAERRPPDGGRARSCHLRCSRHGAGEVHCRLPSCTVGGGWPISVCDFGLVGGFCRSTSVGVNGVLGNPNPGTRRV